MEEFSKTTNQCKQSPQLRVFNVGYFLFMHKKNHVYSTGCNNQMYFLLVYLSAYEFVSFQKQSIDE